MKKINDPSELLREIHSFLCFNNEPSKAETKDLKASILWTLDKVASSQPIVSESDDFKCYEIHRANMPQFGCTEQCKECKQKERTAVCNTCKTSKGPKGQDNYCNMCDHYYY